ncbi:MAG: glycosyltransferase [Bacteroidia bacterium]|nr:glycosyltransferase [Bacteroidales bacterium]NCD42918.1 glycosyltransferase [Bacteroidia bacterium]
MKRVLIITYYWPPGGGAGVQRWLKFSKYLPENGWYPVIYTPENPEVPALDASLEKDIPEACEVIRKPINEPYSFYKRFTGRGKEETVNAGFLDEGRKPGLKDKIAVWIRGNLFIPDARKFWIRPSIKFLTRYLRENPADVMVSTGPPHSMHLIALGIKHKLDIPWVADFRDPWTGIDFYDQLMLTGYADRKHHRLEQEVLQQADRVVTVGWESARLLEHNGGRKVDVITNGFDADDMGDPNAPEERNSNTFTIRHVGAMNKDRNYNSFWQAIKKLNDHKLFKKKLVVELIGKSDAAVRASVEQAGLQDLVSFIAYVPHRKIGGLLRSADLLYLPINNTPNSKAILTGKLFEYIASGTPVLGMGPEDGDAARVLRDAGIGMMLPVDCSPECIVQSVFSLVYQSFTPINPGYDREMYSRKALTSRLTELLEGVYHEG